MRHRWGLIRRPPQPQKERPVWLPSELVDFADMQSCVTTLPGHTKGSHAHMSDQPDTGTQPTIKLNDVEVEGVEAASNSAEPSEPSHTATAGRRRQKVPLAPGHTLAHWNALVQQRRHIPPAVKITPSMLAEHKTQQDAWVSINGKVFDVTRYMDYHPGGS